MWGGRRNLSLCRNGRRALQFFHFSQFSKVGACEARRGDLECDDDGKMRPSTFNAASVLFRSFRRQQTVGGSGRQFGVLVPPSHPILVPFLSRSLRRLGWHMTPNSFFATATLPPRSPSFFRFFHSTPEDFLSVLFCCSKMSESYCRFDFQTNHPRTRDVRQRNAVGGPFFIPTEIIKVIIEANQSRVTLNLCLL